VRRSFCLPGLLLAALPALPLGVPVEKTPHAKLTAGDYIEIPQLCANYAHALDKSEGECFASTFVLDSEFTGGRDRAEAARFEARSRAKVRSWKSAGAAACAVAPLNADLVITPTPKGAKAPVYRLLCDARNTLATIVQPAIYQDTLVTTPQGGSSTNGWSGAMTALS
jgi:hypothetical protein